MLGKPGASNRPTFLFVFCHEAVQLQEELIASLSGGHPVRIGDSTVEYRLGILERMHSSHLGCLMKRAKRPTVLFHQFRSKASEVPRR